MSHEIRFPVNDPADPMSAFFVTGTPEAIQALQTMLKDRFKDGRAVGRAEAQEPEVFIPPEARGEKPLDGLELAG